MTEFVVQMLELVDVRHDHGHPAPIAPGAFNLLQNAELKKSPVENSGQPVQVGELLDSLNIMGVLNRGGANIGHRFERLKISLAKSVWLGTVQSQNSQHLSK